MLRTLLMTAGVMVITFLLLRSLYGLFFNVPLLVVWILLGVLCIGAGKVRLHYHAYLKAASRDDVHARGAMASVLDWLPVRLVGVVYALIGHGEKALPAWFASLADRHTAQYQVLTRLAQFSLAREPHTNKVETPKAAVSMAKKTLFVVVVIVALLTIYGTLV